MTRLALVDLATNAVIDVVPAGQRYIELPDGAGRVSPLVAGWTGGGVLTYRSTKCDARTGEPIVGRVPRSTVVRMRDIARTGPARYGLVAVDDAEIPAGKRKKGDSAYTWDKSRSVVVETVQLEDIPEPKPDTRTAAERLAALLSAEGLTIEDLKEAIK